MREFDRPPLPPSPLPSPPPYSFYIPRSSNPASTILTPPLSPPFLFSFLFPPSFPPPFPHLVFYFPSNHPEFRVLLFPPEIIVDPWRNFLIRFRFVRLPPFYPPFSLPHLFRPSPSPLSRRFTPIKMVCLLDCFKALVFAPAPPLRSRPGRSSFPHIDRKLLIHHH